MWETNAVHIHLRGVQLRRVSVSMMRRFNCGACKTWWLIGTERGQDCDQLRQWVDRLSRHRLCLPHDF
jgi:hypothetical protein